MKILIAGSTLNVAIKVKIIPIPVTRPYSLDLPMVYVLALQQYEVRKYTICILTKPKLFL